MFKKLTGGGILQPRPSIASIVRGSLGGFLGILLLMYLTEWSGTMWIMAPFGSTCVLMFVLPSSPLAQPRSIIGGHLVASFIGLLFIHLLGNSALSVALAIACAIAAMQILRVLHIPAGGDPLVIMLLGINDFNFLLTPVLLGSIALVLAGIVINNIGKDARYPRYWIGAHSSSTSAALEREREKK
ncbi:MAG: HPP family protein [Enterobacteriaceae bacterium]|jgi:CBS-domain-containing membrane protein|nr:HPP family protein [Enterobacteriaceae bacterium]